MLLRDGIRLPDGEGKLRLSALRALLCQKWDAEARRLRGGIRPTTKNERGVPNLLLEKKQFRSYQESGKDMHGTVAGRGTSQC